MTVTSLRLILVKCCRSVCDSHRTTSPVRLSVIFLGMIGAPNIATSPDVHPWSWAGAENVATSGSEAETRWGRVGVGSSIPQDSRVAGNRWQT